MNQSVPLYVA